MTRPIPSIRSAMTAFPYFIDVDADIADAKKMMAEHGIRHLPVTEGDKLIGLVSDRDIKRAQTAEEGALPDEDLSVGDAVIGEAFVVDVTETLDNVLLEMWERKIGSVLVLDAGTLAGIFTCSDACRLFADRLREDSREPV